MKTYYEVQEFHWNSIIFIVSWNSEVKTKCSDHFKTHFQPCQEDSFKDNFPIY